MNIKNLIKVNQFATDNIKELEVAVKTANVENDKDKANFGNLCIALKGFRLVADATEALLYNENCIKADDGSFYQKVEDDIVPPTTAGKPGSDFDIDKENNE